MGWSVEAGSREQVFVSSPLEAVADLLGSERTLAMAKLVSVDLAEAQLVAALEVCESCCHGAERKKWTLELAGTESLVRVLHDLFACWASESDLRVTRRQSHVRCCRTWSPSREEVDACVLRL